MRRHLTDGELGALQELMRTRHHPDGTVHLRTGWSETGTVRIYLQHGRLHREDGPAVEVDGQPWEYAYQGTSVRDWDDLLDVIYAEEPHLLPYILRAYKHGDNIAQLIASIRTAHG